MRRLNGRSHARRRWLVASLVLFALATGVAVAGYIVFAPYRDLDILIINGSVIDGSGSPPRLVSVGIRDHKIVGLSRWRFFFSKAKLTIDAHDRIVSPGFIDVHTHVEPNIPASATFHADNFLRQGVTTLITGNCGRSRTDIGALFRGLDRNGTNINVASLVGHNSVRQEIMNLASRPPTSQELEGMRNLVDRAMKDGAVGFSTGLEYVPGRFAETSEVVALAKVAAKNGGLYASHIRDEGPKGVEAIREALEVGKQAQIPTQISHFKSTGPRQWHTILQRLDLLDEARANGQAVTIDVYPYTSSSTTTDVLLPDWALKDNRSGLRQAAESPAIRQKLHIDIATRLMTEGWNDLSFVRLAAGRPEWIGKTLTQVPKVALDFNEQIENLIDISMRGGAQAVYASMNEQDVAQVVAYPYCVFGSDSAVRDPSAQYLPHPRGSGTFPRVFKQYVREQNLITIGEAVHKATGQAAAIFQLGKRGLLAPGYWADIVVFDPNTIEDKASYDKPFAEPGGLDYVIVNGVVALDHGALTSEKPAGVSVKRASN
jgi:N-acyl-D-amino-acid deacylase